MSNLTQTQYQYDAMFNDLFYRLTSKNNNTADVLQILSEWFENNKEYIEIIGVFEVAEQIINNADIGHDVMSELLFNLFYPLNK